MLESVKKILKFKNPQSYSYFILIFSVYWSMKFFLGFYMFDKVGSDSLVFVPPFSLILNVTDVFFCLIAAYLIDFIARNNKIAFFVLTWATFPPIYYFAIKGYIIYLYFHGFVNFGLNNFLGSKGNETVNFVLYALDVYAVMFLIFLLIITVLYLIFARKSGSYIAKKAPLLPLFFLVAALLMLPFRIAFSEKCERIEASPLFELPLSYITMPDYMPKTYSKDFTPPEKLIFGKEKSSVKVEKGELKKKRNILLLLIESTPYTKKDKLGFFRYFNKNSVEATNFRACFPGTTRSMISTMCGTYSGTEFTALTRYQPDFNCTSLQKKLGENGYRTGLFSAVNLSYDEFDQAKMLRDFSVIEEPSTLTKRYQPKKIHGTGNAIEEEIPIEEIIKFMKKDENPFFVFYYVYWTHSPYEHPFKATGSLPLEERYDESLKYVDESVQKLFEKMKENDLFDETVIIATSDHGQAFGEHPGNYTHSNYIYEESVKVPFIMRSPDFPEQKQTVDVDAAHFDIPATILDFAGINQPENWDGQSLISGNYQQKPRLTFARGIVYSDGILDSNYKYIYYPDGKKEELFDLSLDPLEKNNIAAENKEKTEKYKKLFQEWIPWQQDRITK
ncbi:sulfatase-like hydrolase/transferase [bacterium]|nr:sulfatase-like hydrolase/transferase [bacterium]